MNEEFMLEATGVAFTQLDPMPSDPVSGGDVFGRTPVLARRRHPPEWLDERINQLHRLLKLQENWDSYGAEPIDPRSVRLAEQLLRWLAQFVAIEAPTVTASPDGNAALCWDDGHRSLDVEILADGSIEYAYLNDEDQEGTTLDAEDLAILLTQW